jgi:DNA-binding MurR/RpiR family transcriptional regulator
VKNVSTGRRRVRSVTIRTLAELRVGELVRLRLGDLTPAERRLGKVLLASYPIAGLESLARFAERAGVSPPTVTRFITRLGFRGYPDFQDALRREVQARLSSPLARYDAVPADAGAVSPLDRAFESFHGGLSTTLGLVSPPEFDQVVDLLADRRRRVWVVGGRVSDVLARYLAGQLRLLRPSVSLLGGERSTPAQHLIDLGKRDVLVAFDFRRYQRDTIRSSREAARRGAAVVVVTDPWLSPASASARHVLATGVQSFAPFDSLVGALALVEALVGAVLGRLGAEAQLRMRRLEELRSDATWGEDARDS